MLVPFGNYRLVEILSKGTTTEVYKAIATDGQMAGQLVALKRLALPLATRSEFASTFLRRASIAKCLDHPNIAKTFDVGEIQGRPFVTLEYIQGLDLGRIGEYLHLRGQIMPTQLACFIAAKICDGLASIHSVKNSENSCPSLVHENITPRHVMVSRAGEVKAIGFGPVRTRTTPTKGKNNSSDPGYWSPEQAYGEPVGHQTDIFAVGIILFELLAGERLFGSDPNHNWEVLPLSIYNREIPRELQAMVLRALERNIPDRYQSAAEFSAALQQFLNSANVATSEATLSDWMRDTLPSELFTLETAPSECSAADDSRPDAIETVILSDGAASRPPVLGDANPSETVVSSLKELVEVDDVIRGERIPENSTRPLWYRGQASSRWHLLPGIYRDTVWADCEREIVREFRRLAPGFLPHVPDNELELLFIMQHHGAPTRLLDWSESLLTAVFFALSGPDTGDDAAVWFFDPWCLNENTIGDSSIPLPDEASVAKYVLPRTIRRGKQLPVAQWPVAVRPSNVTPRIGAQKGVFTIHGQSRNGIDERFLDAAIWEDPERWFLRKVTIKATAKQAIFRELYNAGPTHVDLFRDLDGLARSVAYKFSRDYLSRSHGDATGGQRGERSRVAPLPKRPKLGNAR